MMYPEFFFFTGGAVLSYILLYFCAILLHSAAKQTMQKHVQCPLQTSLGLLTSFQRTFALIWC